MAGSSIFLRPGEDQEPWCRDSGEDRGAFAFGVLCRGWTLATTPGELPQRHQACWSTGRQGDGVVLCWDGEVWKQSEKQIVLE